MRLSATERIMREADEEAEDLVANRALAASMPDIDIDIDIDGLDREGDEEEGETQVDFERSAEALQKLRSFGSPASRTAAPPIAVAHPPRAEVIDEPEPPTAPRVYRPPTRQGRGIPPGRPGAAPARAPARPLSSSIEHLLADRPSLPPWPSPSSISHQSPSSSGASLVAVDAPSAPALRPRRGVGRRLGITIAAVTAVAVALAVGTWTAQSGNAASAGVPAKGQSPSADPGASRSGGPPHVAALIVPTPPRETPPAVEAPVADVPAPELTATIPAPRPGSTTTKSSSAVAMAAKRRASSAASKKARHVRKAAAGKAGQRNKVRAMKVVKVAAGPRPTGAAPIAAPSASGRPRDVARSGTDPDDTLPFTR